MKDWFEVWWFAISSTVDNVADFLLFLAIMAFVFGAPLAALFYITS